MKALTFQIHLLEPMLVMDIESGDPNGVASVDYLPGSVIRGELVRLFREGGGAAEAANPVFRQLFLEGAARFLNAYPLSADTQRTLPTPLSWHSFKDGDENVRYDFIFKQDEEDQTRQRETKPFCRLWLSENDHGNVVGKAELIKPDHQLTIHTARDDRQTNDPKKPGAVFRYDALAAGQAFGGVIIADDMTVLNQLHELLKSHLQLYLGKSRTAGYGRVEIKALALEMDWREYTPIGDDAEGGFLTVTLLSDALVRDSASGTFTLDLAPVLGVAAQPAFTRSRIVGGFNRKWNLPLPQAHALHAGSVFCYPHTPALASRLQALEITGIGERRAEGFGRLAVNWHRLEKITAKKDAPQKPAPLPKPLPETHLPLAKRMVERMARTELDKRLTAKVVNLRVELHGLRSAQVSRIRLAAREMARQGNGKPLADQFDSQNGMKKTAREQFEKARIHGKPLADWLVAIAADPAKVWNELGGVNANDLPKLGQVRGELTAEMAADYAARLIAGVLRHAQRADKDKRNG